MIGSIRFETVVLSNNPESIYGNEGVLVFINLALSADVLDELIISGNTYDLSVTSVLDTIDLKK